MNIATIVLSAGKGTRMKSEIPKVLHKVLGKEIILWSNDALKNFENKFIVIGHQHQLVEEYISDDSQTIIQQQQLGTGHALLVVFNDESFLSSTYDYVLVVPGDVPLIEEETLNRLITKVIDYDAAIGFLVLHPGGNVFRIAANEIVTTYHIAPHGHVSLGQMASEKSGYAGYEYAHTSLFNHGGRRIGF